MPPSTPERGERAPHQDGPSGFSSRFESSIAALGMSAAHHPWSTLVLVGIAVGFCASQLPTMQFASSPDLYLDEDDPARVEYSVMRTQFGRDDLVFIAVTPPSGGVPLDEPERVAHEIARFMDTQR